MVYLYLFIAIASEVVATSALKASEEFTQWLPSLTVVIGYGISFYFLTLVLRAMPLGITYAIWSGLGIIMVAVIGIIWCREIPDLAAIIGMGLIILGVTIIHLFSKTIS